MGEAFPWRGKKNHTACVNFYNRGCKNLQGMWTVEFKDDRITEQLSLERTSGGPTSLFIVGSAMRSEQVT